MAIMAQFKIIITKYENTLASVPFIILLRIIGTDYKNVFNASILHEIGVKIL